MNPREQRPDACPYSTTPDSYPECPAFEPDDFPVSDSRERSLSVITTCRHLTVGGDDLAGGGAFYARCRLGCAQDRASLSGGRGGGPPGEAA